MDDPVVLGRRYHLTRVNRWSDCIGYRIEIVCQIGTLSTILQHLTHTMKPSDPLLLADGTLRLGMYPTGKVAISQHLATVTILSASSVQTLVHKMYTLIEN